MLLQYSFNCNGRNAPLLLNVQGNTIHPAINDLRENGEFPMAKKVNRIPEVFQVWVAARKQHKLNDAQVQMARELGLNPKKLGSIGNDKQEPWKLPLPQFIEKLYFERFGKMSPEIVTSMEQRAEQVANKKEAKRKAKMGEIAKKMSDAAVVAGSRKMEEPSAGQKQVLFLCTWNYYRSRFAEIYFNWEAAAVQVAWRAESRGLALPESTPKSISGYTANYLNELSIPFDTERKPMDACVSDFARAERIIAIKREEHFPIIQRRFEEFAPRVEYWDIHDIDASTPEVQLPLLRARVRQLVNEIVSF